MNATPTSRTSLAHRTLTAAMLGCFSLGGWFWHHESTPKSQQAHAAIASRLPYHDRQEVVAPSAAKPLRTQVATSPRYVTKNIEDIHLGQRLVGLNPLRHETSLPSEIDPATWRAVRLTMLQGGVFYELAFLRSLEWLDVEEAKVGQHIDLLMPEMGLLGPALVESIELCPDIEPDDGTGRMIVTGTMKHLATNVLNLTITGLEKPLGVTTTHPIWSETRQAFLPAGQLKEGEHLKQLDGTITQVTRISPKRGPPELVYNLEVDAEHVYHVSDTGLLVHNVCPWEVGPFNVLKSKSNPFDGLDIHHAGQQNPMSQLISGYNPRTAPAIAVPEKLHEQLATLKGKVSGSARGQLAKDIRDLRSIGAPNDALKQLIDLNKNTYLEAFAK